ncbi:retron system putative HNH endonuclease [Bifidobacterium aerophilum]|uniref:TIGR02646 family protein n=1 Tax=Bifidobacterium aerophilum TaxID=1798155 RepID=A0A6N9Z7Y7_9BIFI|nr:retron system putative HNH endonuclease [Bifidobacterium aerophilum]NEG90621.1 TIGR02646 family protein [Bifidobacterium aerophilum]
MLLIKKGNAPYEFAACVPTVLSSDNLNLDGETPFDLLTSGAKSELKESLLKEQGYLCAYCMRGIDADRMRVEHWHPQSDGVEGARLSVQYSNMFACCEGGEETKAPPEDQTCDKRKGERFITVNPTSQSDIDTIYYQEDGVIKSMDPAIQSDLGEPGETGKKALSPLGLNQKDLIRNREAIWASIKTKLKNIHGKDASIRFCRSMLKEYEQPSTSLNRKKAGHRKAYAGIVIFFLKRELRSYGVQA